MLAYFGGRERSVDELATLGAACGLTLAGVHAAGPNVVIRFASG